MRPANFSITCSSKTFPEFAVRFRGAVQRTAEFLSKNPFAGPRYSRKARLEGLRSWPVAGFEAIRIYYLPAGHAVKIVRILHGKRAMKPLIEGKEG